MKFSDERLGSVESRIFTIAHINEQVSAAKHEAYKVLCTQFLEALELLNELPELALWMSQSLIAFNTCAAITCQRVRDMQAASAPEIIVATELPPQEPGREN